MTTADIVNRYAGDAKAGPMARYRFWAGVQGATALFFSTFLVLHLVTIVLAAFGPAAYNGFLKAARVYYQHPLVEAPVMASFVGHIAAGFLKGKLPGQENVPRSRTLSKKIHSVTGWIMVFFIGGHVGATRLFPLLGISPALNFNSVAAMTRYLPTIFLPYFLVYGVAGTVHMLTGLPAALQQSRLVLPQLAPMARLVKRVPVGVTTVAVLAVILGVCGIAGAIYPYRVEQDEFVHHLSIHHRPVVGFLWQEQPNDDVSSTHDEAAAPHIPHTA